jgi:hypothetical protein
MKIVNPFVLILCPFTSLFCYIVSRKWVVTKIYNWLNSIEGAESIAETIRVKYFELSGIDVKIK